MALKIYNTLTRRKEEFQPLEPGRVRMYVCGITAYDECHLGHARAGVVFDIIYRYLRFLGYEVTYVRNFTDVDDKIINKAKEGGLPCEAVAEQYIASYTQAMDQLGLRPPTHEPRASRHIPEMIELIRTLEQKGFAYVAGNDVIFSVRKSESYGQLSHHKLDDLIAGARVEVNEKKRDPLDFVLWKGSKPGEPKWSSPWGEGRPGWHIECSAMSMKYLGEGFDIHGGGRDLIFPHHENEILQSEAVTGKPFVRTWIHNGFVNIDAEKMSKSLGNIRTIPAILERWHPEAIRLFLLSTHYRSPINFTEGTLDENESALRRLYETLARLQAFPAGGPPLPEMHLLPTFERNMGDDFNAAQFLGILFTRIRRLNGWLDKNSSVDGASRSAFFEEVGKIAGILGILEQAPQKFLEGEKGKRVSASGLTREEIEARIREREQARLAKDFQRADAIRKALTSQGIELRDNPDGTTGWQAK